MKLTQLKCSPKIKMAGGQTNPKNWVANNFEPARKPLDNNCVSRRDFMLWLVQIKLKPCQPQEICNNTIVEREASKPLTLKTSWSLSHSCEWILGIGKSCWRRGPQRRYVVNHGNGNSHWMGNGNGKLFINCWFFTARSEYQKVNFLTGNLWMHLRIGG